MSDTPIADMLEQMLAKGATLEGAIPAVRVLEMSRTNAFNVPDKAAIIREYEREKKKNRRNKSKANVGGAKANDVAHPAPNVRDMSGTAAKNRCDDRSSFLSLKGTPEEEKKEKKVARARGTRLPQGWQPSAVDRQFAIDNGVNPDAALAEFTDYWNSIPGQRGVKLDWPATWRNRIRDLKGKTNGRPYQTRPDSGAGSAAPGNDAVMAGMANLARRRREARAAAGPDDGTLPFGDDAAEILDLEPVRTDRH